MMRDFCFEQTRESVEDDWEEFDLEDVRTQLDVDRVSCRVYYSADNLTKRLMVFRGNTNDTEIQVLLNLGFVVWDINKPAFPIPVKPEPVVNETPKPEDSSSRVLASLHNPEGLEDYAWGALSPNDPTQVPMKYFTKEAAEAHANSMNALIDSWEENPKGFWNKDHWKVKPAPWVVKELK
jgi:hypothetical protein